MESNKFMMFLRDLIVARTGEDPRNLNSVYLREYKDGKSGVGWHRDDEDLYAPDKQSIYSFTLGAERTFQVKENGKKDTDFAWSGPLGEGRLVAMVGHFQNDYLHRVPQERHNTRRRINITFRKIVNHTCNCKKLLDIKEVLRKDVEQSRRAPLEVLSTETSADSQTNCISEDVKSKQVRKLRKQLHEIDELVEREASGEELRTNQKQKVAKRFEFEQNLRELCNDTHVEQLQADASSDVAELVQADLPLANQPQRRWNGTSSDVAELVQADLPVANRPQRRWNHRRA